MSGLPCADGANESKIHPFWGWGRTRILPLNKGEYTMFAFILKRECPIESLEYSIGLWCKKKVSTQRWLGPRPVASQALGKKYVLQKYFLRTVFDLRVKTMRKRQ